jgi:hypothetical protein
LNDLVLAVDAEFLADLDLHRQAVRIPARLSLAVVAAHRAVARKEVLDRAGQTVAGVRQTVGRRRAFVKDENARRFAAFAAGVVVGPASGEGLFVNAVDLPEVEDLAFHRGEVELGRNLSEHGITSPNAESGAAVTFASVSRALLATSPGRSPPATTPPRAAPIIAGGEFARCVKI